MKAKIKALTAFHFFIVFTFIVQASEIKIKFSQNLFTIENQFNCRQFKYEKKSGIYYFYPSQWTIKSEKKNFLNSENRQWFSFVINGREINSKDGGWKFENYKIHPLKNGGKEVVIVLRGQAKRSAIHGKMKLIYYCRVFKDSPIFRERIEILPQTDQTIFLDKNDNHCQFIFPEYHWKNLEIQRLQLREIQLANWEGEVLDKVNWNVRPNYRLKLTGGSSGRNLSQNHMYHPKRNHFSFASNKKIENLKGPLILLFDKKNSVQILFAYEHGSMDNEPEQQYLGISAEKLSNETLAIKIEGIRGIYFSHQIVTKNSPFKSIWFDVGVFQGNSFQKGEKEIFNFIYHDISEHLASRMPTIYYNTWGLQRDEQIDKKAKPQSVLTEQRVLEEIEYAHQLGADVFVIDDGWQTCFGDWKISKDRFPNGFKKIKSKLDSLGMKLGLWFAAAGIDKKSKLYAEHPEYLARKLDGSEVIGRWNKPVGCFSSDFKNHFIKLCKYWIDQGVTYFKWDGLDAFSCSSPEHWHGDKTVPASDRAENSSFRQILEITDAARQITDYAPEVIIVLDVTEKSRPVGLAFLSESRFFWINNGATWYDDLSHYRAKSIRSVANLYNQIIPTVLQTSANYPHQSPRYGAQMYNVHTSFLGGNGFWGDLSEMKAEQRKSVAELVKTYKKVATTAVSIQPLVTGKIGSSPEIYEFIDPQKAEGMVIAFSSSAMEMKYQTQVINKKNFLALLRNSYSLTENGNIELPLLFPQADAVCSAFVLSHKEAKLQIISSTCWLKEAEIKENKLYYVNGAAGKQIVCWHEKGKSPEVLTANGKKVDFEILDDKNGSKLLISTPEPETAVIVSLK